MLTNLREQWFSNVRADILSGLVVGLALIPEAIAFSIIAGVDPQIGLYASFCIAVIISFVGGRPAMISAATGAMALVMTTLVKEHGLQYLFAATILTGVIQIIVGYLKLAKLMRFVSKSVVIGFVNALAILIFMAQLPELVNVSWYVYLLVAIGLAIIYLFPYVPKLGKIFPSPLICIVIVTLLALFLGLDVRTVGDMGALPNTLPIFLIPDIPLNLDTLLIILPYSLALAAVGLLESMMTATIVDEMTDSPSNKFKECKGQGIANIASGFMGGMAGCAMIGQSMINVKSGGRTRLSTLCAGIFLLILVVFLSDWLKFIPMAALVAVMIMVSISTFEWRSLTQFKTNPKSSNTVMIATVVVVVATHNLALGVLTGVLLSALFLANKLENDIQVITSLEGNARLYDLRGQIFFSSSDRFMQGFNFKEDVKEVIIDLTHSHIWDVTSVAMLDSAVEKFQKNGIQVTVRGLNEASSIMIDKYGTHAKI
ncbi:SulP family inorganic anion transporter [Acinetobacter baumannii]|uniref:SulP family inorganic anion transporter n=2 Tax=Acinetobacter baumannii TaxID=470 RepID=UPI0002B9362E|nr:SulP family inorganic anion transporter [Acinetobacter baumannii]AVF08182.1 SulP family inorganic anion transporter [Acinetobacter baumannii]EHU2106937.1 SulP family inorganic anion transporter [Acinetobacter baumannii]EHU2363465.1 SulP family inorganic anion transporter [Acinetobacter baumannii]EHU3227745.1 SulP family inorganic anion transporter [Acinetobacter baumannii]EIB7121796.1 SulP family inorganic anion transporter [Acinetobacter baumannii]